MASAVPPPRLLVLGRSVVPRPLRVAMAMAGTASFLHAGNVFAQNPTPTASAPNDPVPATLFNAAVTNFDHGDYQGAVTTIESLLKLFPKDLTPAEKTKVEALLEPTYFTLGAAHFNLNRFPQAIAALKDYLTRYPKSTRVNDVQFSMAQANYLNKDFAAAAQGFAALENVSSYRAQALLSEGLSYKTLHEDTKAVPAGTNRFTVGYLLGATALQENDPKATESYFGRMAKA